MEKANKYRLFRYICVFLCALLNIVLSYITATIGLPVYLDSIGTILMSFLGGFFPGIITAIISNLIEAAFNQDAAYFILIGVLIAACASNFSQKELYKKKINIMWLIVIISLIGGGLGLLFQILLLGEPQFLYITETASIIAKDNKVLLAFVQLFLSIALNIVDKGFAVIMAVLIFNLIPLEFRQNVWNSGWKQKPLSRLEANNITSYKMEERTSFRVKVTLMMITISAALSIIISSVSSRMLYSSVLSEARAQVEDIAILIDKNIKESAFEKYLSDNEYVSKYDNPDYINENEFLLSLKNTFSEIDNLKIYRIKEDAYYSIFDVDTEFQKSGRIGERYEYDEKLARAVPRMLKGEKFDEIGKKDEDNYSVTAFEPIHDKNGEKSSYYILAQLALLDYSSYIKEYVIKMILLCSGFFVLILSYGLELSAYNFVYPIGSLEKSIDEIMKSMDDQDQLEKNVRKLQKLDIKTNDEIERLYKAFSEMAIVTAQQMRSTLILANSNKKMQSGLIITMADLMEGRGLDSKAHFQRMTAYVRIILIGLKRRGYYAEKLTDKYQYDVETSAPLYDIGKINIPEVILNKHGKLNDEENEIYKSHTTAGKKILENAISTVEGENYLKEARNMAAYHHERWDGQGYPEGLHGEVIPLSARIIAVADYFEDLTSFYDDIEPIPVEKAMDILKKESGSRFDPKCVEVFVMEEAQIRKIIRKYQET
ncbi:HD-GYP domain-containing protein [Butyrivibrio sp. WCE2006]|uniref:HD-GYP domain-containing protein n=1 Tax=Butyrivibrio sp. WCE2006 TaxID=1410611 RepID=UPI0006792CDF|nr:HD domain-containing phosphohydrolase [Butyrivibrio sp. WCE2006]